MSKEHENNHTEWVTEEQNQSWGPLTPPTVLYTQLQSTPNENAPLLPSKEVFYLPSDLLTDDADDALLLNLNQMSLKAEQSEQETKRKSVLSPLGSFFQKKYPPKFPSAPPSSPNSDGQPLFKPTLFTSHEFTSGTPTTALNDDFASGYTTKGHEVPQSPNNISVLPFTPPPTLNKPPFSNNFSGSLSTLTPLPSLSTEQKPWIDSDEETFWNGPKQRRHTEPSRLDEFFLYTRPLKQQQQQQPPEFMNDAYLKETSLVRSLPPLQSQQQQQELSPLVLKQRMSRKRAKSDFQQTTHTNTDMKKFTLYKTELCRSYEETGKCKFMNKCLFAHGMDELRQVSRHPRYKTEICKSFWEEGNCKYGKRCCFLHLEKKNEMDLADDQVLREGKEQRKRTTSRLETLANIPLDQSNQ